MKKLTLLTALFFTYTLLTSAAEIKNIKYSADDIKKIAGSYMESGLPFENPVMVDVDNDGDFDALNFDDGNVEFYKNTGTLEKPVFILENKNYESYNNAFFVKSGIPYPMFFADSDGDGDMDMFVVKDKTFNTVQNKYDYNISSAENSLSLDTGTLITIILVLVIVLLVLAILK